MHQIPFEFFSQSTNDLTASCINYLNINGFKAWRNNNGGIYDKSIGVYRKVPNSLKGVPDIIGYHIATGAFVGIEIKAGKDKRSPEQKQFITEAKNAQTFAMFVCNLHELINAVDDWKKEKAKKNTL